MRYDAFISYRHTPLDLEIAKKVHSGLEGTKIPGPIQKKFGKKNIKRVFRDQEELPIGSDLNDNISQALSDSEFLIVICSPRTPESEWVQREIETFIKMHDRQHVLAVLIEGEPDESFPELLLKDENGNPVEPLAADVRGETAKERNTKLKTEILRLAAPLIGCTYDDLKQRHRERKLKRMCAILCGAFSLFAVLGVGFAVYNAKMAAEIDRNYKKSLENQYRYMADSALDLFEDGYRKDAILVATEALADDSDDMPYVPQAEHALSEALYTYDTGNDIGKDGVLEHSSPISSMEYDTDGCHLITIDNNKNISVWDIANGNELVTEFKPVNGKNGNIERAVKCNHVGDEIIVCSAAGVSGYSLDGEMKWNVDTYCINACFDVENNRVIVQAAGQIQVVDIVEHAVAKSYLPGKAGAIYCKLFYDITNERVFAGEQLDGENALVDVIDLKEDSLKTLELAQDSFSTLAFSEACVYTASYAEESLIEGLTTPYSMYIQSFNILSGEEEWNYDTEFVEAGINDNAVTMLKYRSYPDATGFEHNELVLSSNNKIVCLNADTGSEVSEFAMAGGVRAALLSTSSPLGYAAMSTGKIEVLNYTEGTMLQEYSMETGYRISDLKVSNGIFAVCSYTSPDVLVMKHHTGNNMEEVLTADHSLVQVTKSRDEKTIVAYDGVMGDSGFYFIDADTAGDEATVRTYDYDEAAYSVDNFYITSDNRLIVFNVIGNAVIVDPVTLEEKVVKIEHSSDLQSFNSYISASGDYAVSFGPGEVNLIDIAAGEEAGQWLYMGDYISDAVITNDGSKIYIASFLEGLLEIDVKSGATNCLDGIDNACSYSLNTKSLGVSASGRYVAVACKDGKLKIYDTEVKSVCAEIEFSGSEDSFIEFSSDESSLIVQGSDRNIGIYKTANGEKLYMSDKQYNILNDCIEFADGSRLALVMADGMLVLDTNTYIPVADIDGGCTIVNGRDVIIKNSKCLYRFPYQTVNSLKEEAARQLNGAELSEDKRTKYHM